MSVLEPNERDVRWLRLDLRALARANEALRDIRAEAIHRRRAIGQHARQALTRWLRETGRHDAVPEGDRAGRPGRTARAHLRPAAR